MEKLGPWLRQELNEFLNLTWSVKFPPALNALASPERRAKQESEHAKQVFASVQSHRIFAWLQNNPHFRNAWKTFQARQRKRCKLTTPLAEIEFLEALCFHAGSYFSRKGRSGRASATARTREKALRAAKTLMQERVNGVRLTSSADNDEFFRLLAKLGYELSTVARKKYEGPKAIERDTIVNLGVSMLLMLGYCSPAILSDFGHMIGCELDHSTVERYSRAAAAKHRQVLAEALLRHQQKSTA
jgi:hypothetical protein